MRRVDTPALFQAKYDQLWQQLSPGERFQKGMTLIALSRQLLMAGLKTRHPNLNPAQLAAALRQYLYGEREPRYATTAAVSRRAAL